MHEQRQLSDSELQKLRDDITEKERRRWLCRLIRTAAAWTAGTLAAILSLTDGAIRLVDWLTRK
jgi:hypothetical protein